MTHYTPTETDVINQLTHAMLDAGIPVKAVKIFGSRARGHSSASSDLDIAVELDSARDPGMSRQVVELGRDLSITDEASGFGLRVQAVPFFRGEQNGYLARAIAPEAETVWTRT